MSAFAIMRARADDRPRAIDFDAPGWRMAWFRLAGAVGSVAGELRACYSPALQDLAKERDRLWTTLIGTPGAVSAVIAECERVIETLPQAALTGGGRATIYLQRPAWN